MAQLVCCPRCKTELSADAPDGLCPACLFGQVIDSRYDVAERPTARSPAPAFVPPRPAELNRHFPDLQILELLGQGGMGAVYKARQIKLDRLVALKIMPPEVARDPAFAERFTREARSLARLNHANIVTIHDFGDADGLYYFTMEYVDGRNLRDLLNAGAISPEQALGIVPRICDALQYAHDEGLVHRDIKPENILLDRKGRVKIADFGLAKLVGLTPTYLTLTGAHEVMGTLLYMAPEQMKRAHTVDHRADLYSLGVVLYEMLTGELPLGRFAPPSQKAPVNERLDQVVLRALARDPAERFQDAGAFRHELEAALAPSIKGVQGGLPSGQRWAKTAVPTWPSARFDIHREHDHHAVAHGLITRDEQALILGFEYAKKSLMKRFKAFLTEGGQPREVRIPLGEIASLSPGWGWGRPPRTLILQVTRMAALAGLPEAVQGRVELHIPRGDRSAARQLFESIAHARGDAAGVAGAFGDPGQAKSEVAIPAIGFFVTGLVTLLSWLTVLVVLGYSGQDMAVGSRISLFLAPFAALTVAVSGLLMTAGLLMLRLRGYPLAATASILAMIPWSPGWLIGLPFGIWACVVLGRPNVVDAFHSAKRPHPSPPPLPPNPSNPVGGRFLSLLRSIGGYLGPTLHWRQPPGNDQRSNSVGNDQ